jgi:hypothetical protein
MVLADRLMLCVERRRLPAGRGQLLAEGLTVLAEQ